MITVAVHFVMILPLLYSFEWGGNHYPFPWISSTGTEDPNFVHVMFYLSHSSYTSSQPALVAFVDWLMSATSEEDI